MRTREASLDDGHDEVPQHASHHCAALDAATLAIGPAVEPPRLPLPRATRDVPGPEARVTTRGAVVCPYQSRAPPTVHA